MKPHPVPRFLRNLRLWGSFGTPSVVAFASQSISKVSVSGLNIPDGYHLFLHLPLLPSGPPPHTACG